MNYPQLGLQIVLMFCVVAFVVSVGVYLDARRAVRAADARLAAIIAAHGHEFVDTLRTATPKENDR